MIPKVIHYCWFGEKALPAKAKKCIGSWRKYLPGYEIKEWNDSNFDLAISQFVASAYEQKMYAFVSDYARFWILYHYGGVYFDVDVEIVSDMSHIIDAGAFMGIEKSLATNGIAQGCMIGVAPGLGMGAEAGMSLIYEILEYYNSLIFNISDCTVVGHTTRILRTHGLANRNEMQSVAGFTIYPDRYLCPMDSTTGIVSITPDTVSIHHYACSWMDHKSASFVLHKVKNWLIRVFGVKLVTSVTNLLK